MNCEVFPLTKRLPPIRHVIFALSAGCFAHTTSIRDLDERGSLEVRLDANARALAPGQGIKFLVDLLNQTSSRIDLEGLKVELRASPEKAPETVSLRHSWSFNWRQAVFLEPGKKLTLPLLRERGLDLPLNKTVRKDQWIVEFPLEDLSPGNYTIVALVNGRHASSPCPLRIVRPDLESWTPSTKPGPSS